MVIAPEQLQQNLTQLSADELRQAVTNLLQTVAAKEGALAQQAQALAFNHPCRIAYLHVKSQILCLTSRLVH